MVDPFGLVGSTIDMKYRVDAPVGEGGFAIVYKGWHLTVRSHIAIKVLKIPGHFSAQARQVFLDKFYDEGRTLFGLSEHPSIVRVFDCGVTTAGHGQQLPYLILEWLNGCPLDEFFAKTRERRRFTRSSSGSLPGDRRSRRLPFRQHGTV